VRYFGGDDRGMPILGTERQDAEAPAGAPDAAEVVTLLPQQRRDRCARGVDQRGGKGGGRQVWTVLLGQERGHAGCDPSGGGMRATLAYTGERGIINDGKRWAHPDMLRRKVKEQVGYEHAGGERRCHQESTSVALQQ
jgi:hypothetical protein